MAESEPLNRSGQLSPAFESVMSAASVPVLVKNGDGYYIFANRAAEALLGYDHGQIGGLHVSELIDSDPEWLNTEFERFKAERVWNGFLVFRHREGRVVQAAVNAFGATLTNGLVAYTAFPHPVAPDFVLLFRPPAQRIYDLSAADIRLIQLLAEGFTDLDLSNILGLSEWAVTREIAIVLQKMRVSSRTEACIRAIKANLIL
jgi:PAS domain S-box-containing protein